MPSSARAHTRSRPRGQLPVCVQDVFVSTCMCPTSTAFGHALLRLAEFNETRQGRASADGFDQRLSAGEDSARPSTVGSRRLPRPLSGKCLNALPPFAL
eukprot:5794522-Pleurochrysis_carterae.AAC.1